MTCITTDIPARPTIKAHWLATILLLVVMGLPALTAPRSDTQQLDWHGNAATLQP